MIRIVVISLGLAAVPLPLHAGWIVRQGNTQIQYSAQQDEGYASFEEALKQVSKSGRIQSLNTLFVTPLLRDEIFQKELFAALERNAPHKLEAALNSAGNMHNPKMENLSSAFLDAVLATNTVRQFNTALGAYGLQVSRATQEKLELRKSDAGKRFYCYLTLEVTKSSGTR